MAQEILGVFVMIMLNKEEKAECLSSVNWLRWAMNSLMCLKLFEKRRNEMNVLIELLITIDNRYMLGLTK